MACFLDRVPDKDGGRLVVAGGASASLGGNGAIHIIADLYPDRYLGPRSLRKNGIHRPIEGRPAAGHWSESMVTVGNL